MTLNLTIVNSWGIWQCSDHRLVNLGSGRVLDDYTVKHVNLRCPDGVALVAYAGVGRLRGVDISDWIRETLRGESRTIDQSLIAIRENATLDLGPRIAGRMHHMFSVGAFLKGVPWIVQIRNFDAMTPYSIGPPTREFQTVAKAVPEGGPFTFGAPISDADRALMMRVASRRPRKPIEFRNLLAAINRRTAESRQGGATVSRHCVTTFAPPEGEPLDSQFHDAAGAPRPMIIPMLLFGIDMTEIQRDVIRLAERQQLETELSNSAARESVIPRNRLR